MNQNAIVEIRNLSCCHSEFYKNMSVFKFLPGNSTIILCLPKLIIDYHQIRRMTAPMRKGIYPFILDEMIQTAELNRLKDKNHASYGDSIRFFATYVFLLCGRSCYEMLHANLPIPSTKPIRKQIFYYEYTYCDQILFFFRHPVRCINHNKNQIVEGQLRAKELADYLDRLKTTKHVWLSEDATAIIQKVTYDPTTNQMIGLVLPRDKITGCPKPFTFLATDAAAIKQHLMQEKSTVLYLIMAQPLDERIPPFVLQLFGSDNRFTKEDVIKRWNFTKNELQRFYSHFFMIKIDYSNKIRNFQAWNYDFWLVLRW